MHIAKTAGSYINEVVRRDLGDDKVFLHAEGRIGDHKSAGELLDRGVKFISGHIYYSNWKRIIEKLNTSFCYVTVIRPPIEHLASHILWLDHYNQPEYRDGYKMLPESVKRLVDLIGVTNLSDVGEVDRLMTNLPPTGMKYLDNCQSRYFLCGAEQPFSDVEPLTLAARFALAKRLNDFDVVARQDILSQEIERINSTLGLKLTPLDERINEAKSSRSLNLKNEYIRAILSKRVLLDNWLWQRVTSNH